MAMPNPLIVPSQDNITLGGMMGRSAVGGPIPSNWADVFQKNYIPSCKHEDDPARTGEMPPPSKWYKNDMLKAEDFPCVYVGHDCNHHVGDYPSNKWRNYYTEYYLAGVARKTESNYEVGHVDCATTSQCSVAAQVLDLTCTNFAHDVGVEIDTNFGLKVPELLKRVLEIEIDIDPSYSYTWGAQNCKTESSTQTCYWEDKQCHAVYASQTSLVIYGYALGVAHNPNYNNWGNVGTDHPKARFDGWHVQGSSNFSFEWALPSGAGVETNCKGSCTPPVQQQDPVQYHDFVRFPFDDSLRNNEPA